MAIPNQLTSGNLSTLPEGSRYRILTSGGDRARLENADGVRALRSQIAVDIVVMDSDPLDVTKYHQMIRYHRRAVQDALDCGAALIFLAPDHVLGTGTMARVARCHADGYRAVVCPALTLSKEGMLDALAAYGAPGVPPRALVRMALDHLHPATLVYMADATHFSHHPTSVYWRVGSTGLLGRSFSLHPLMLDPVRPELPRREIDADYLWRSVPDPAKVYLVADSDDLIVFQLAMAHNVVTPGGPAWSKAWRAARVAALCDPHQLSFWRRPIRLHSNDLGAEWAEVEQESARFAGRVLRRFPYVRQALPVTRRLSQWQQQWDRRSREWRRRLPTVRLKQVKRPGAIAIHRVRKRLRRALRS